MLLLPAGGAQGAPDLFRRRGHFDGLGAGAAQGVGQGIHHRRRRPGGGTFPRALGPDGVVGFGHFIEVEVEGGQVSRPGQAVIHQTAVQGLAAVRVINHLFEQRLANTLGDFGIPFNAGEIILSGSLVPLEPAFAGDHFHMSIEGLGQCDAHFI